MSADATASDGSSGAGATPGSGAAGNAGRRAPGARSDGGTEYPDADGGEYDPSTGRQDAAAPAPAPTRSDCPKTTYATGSSRIALQHGGRDRAFEVYVPASLAAAVPAALVLDFHAEGSSASTERAASGWREKADSERFIVAYPEGVSGSWNAEPCCGQAVSQNVDDVGFARSVLAEVGRAICVDSKRVYATGLSNGGALAQRLACEAADAFAAIAAASADLLSESCLPVRAIAVLAIRGQSDSVVAYEGGSGADGWYSPGAEATFEHWKRIDGCGGSPEATPAYCESYGNCRAGVEVSLCSLPGTGHNVYDNALGFSVPALAWDMFRRQALP